MLAVLFVIDLPDLGGREKIEALGVPVRTLISFEGRLSHRPHPEEARSRGLGAISKDGMFAPVFAAHGSRRSLRLLLTMRSYRVYPPSPDTWLFEPRVPLSRQRERACCPSLGMCFPRPLEERDRVRGKYNTFTSAGPPCLRHEWDAGFNSWVWCASGVWFSQSP